MPLIQLDLTQEQADKLEHYAIAKHLSGKQQAILDLIDSLDIEVRIKKTGERVITINKNEKKAEK